MPKIMSKNNIKNNNVKNKIKEYVTSKDNVKK